MDVWAASATPPCPIQALRPADCQVDYHDGLLMPRARVAPQQDVPGLAARRIAADILDGVLRPKRQLDEQLDGKQAHPGLAALADRDRALVRRLVATVLRRLGTLRHLLRGVLDRGFPNDSPRIETVLLVGTPETLWSVP